MLALMRQDGAVRGLKVGCMGTTLDDHPSCFRQDSEACKLFLGLLPPFNIRFFYMDSLKPIVLNCLLKSCGEAVAMNRTTKFNFANTTLF
ncbi:unknown protein [Desulfotalea psychrophila LSv54]|uniref:Uncharacterized protein n=1 Tax=Desulfotalea psychrophila (strain LSv54 / DSM 12343) TaxID=177439 RepID=Q6AKG5_DESPS|nr:unknown protein [Desulfotalea psychrophila LSv54]